MRRTRRRTDIWPRFWRRQPLAAAILVLAVALMVYTRARTPLGTEHERYHNRVFTCTRVVDGDTLDIAASDGDSPVTRIRLWGVDTPETAKSPQGAQYYGAEATAFSKSMVEGKSVRVVLAPGRTRDRYDRLLAYIYPADGEAMLNEEIIAQGYGYADTRFDHVWKARFITLEERARRQKLGLWQAVTPDQMPEWRRRMESRDAAR